MEQTAAIVWTVVLVTVVFDYCLSLVANILNLGSLTETMPKEFEGFYEQEKYAKSQRYTRTNTAFGNVSSTFDVVVLLSFWMLGGFNIVDGFVRTVFTNEIAQGLLFIFTTLLGQYLLSLPFSVYKTFVIEEKFGFNKTTAKTFVMDALKMMALTAALAGPLLAAVLSFFLLAGELAWLYVWLLMTAFTLFVSFIAPVYIMPIFNKFTPLAEGPLLEAINSFAAKVNFEFSGIFVIDGSKRSNHSNAFFTGFGKNKRIALFDTLIEKSSTEELVAVLAHEVGHYQLGHIQKGIAISILHTGAIMFLLSFFMHWQPLYEAFYVQNQSVYMGFILFQTLLLSPIEMCINILMTMQSRQHEFDADAYSVRTNKDPDALAVGLKKLAQDNLSNLTPHPLHVFLTYSHPPVLARTAAIQKLASKAK